MSQQVPSVAIPAIPFFHNLVVFPSPTSESNDSRFFLLKNVADVPMCSSEKMWVEYIPGSIYCFLPSTERNQGRVSVYESKPNFLDDFSYSLEINKNSIVFQNLKSEAEEVSTIEDETVSVECRRCFVSHWPRPNKRLCKFGQDKKKKKYETIWPYRLRGGANTRQYSSIIERASLNANAHV
jgi:hypothetical protein